MSQSKYYNRTGPTEPMGPHGIYFFALPSRITGLVTKKNHNLIVLKLISCFVSASKTCKIFFKSSCSITKRNNFLIVLN